MLNEISYLGFLINSNGFSPDKSRLENFKMWNKPKTVRQLQKMLGKINWYRIYIKNISSLLSPLYDHLKNNKTNKVCISDRKMKIVHEIYENLKTKALLYYPNLNESFIYKQMRAIRE
jgi:hypothetical protein